MIFDSIKYTNNINLNVYTIRYDITCSYKCTVEKYFNFIHIILGPNKINTTDQCIEK